MKYEVNIFFRGDYTSEVKAENEDVARDIALDRFQENVNIDVEIMDTEFIEISE